VQSAIIHPYGVKIKTINFKIIKVLYNLKKENMLFKIRTSKLSEDYLKGGNALALILEL